MENKLTVFSKKVIPVYTTDTGDKVVIGRELHDLLKIETPYIKWFPRMCEYGFSEERDFQTFLSESTGGRPAENHILKLEMAKHISMIQRTPEGKAIRDQLIALETNVSELSPDLRVLIGLELAQKEQARAIAEVNQRVDNISEIVSLDANAWRDRSKHIIVKIAEKWGGAQYIPEVHKELYRLLEQSAHVNLKRRLEGRKGRMLTEGASKTAARNLNNLDVIAADPKLIAIYLDLVKRMAIKHEVNVQGLMDEVTA